MVIHIMRLIWILVGTFFLYALVEEAAFLQRDGIELDRGERLRSQDPLVAQPEELELTDVKVLVLQGFGVHRNHDNTPMHGASEQKSKLLAKPISGEKLAPLAREA